MPRLARIDYPGALQHVIVRGINRKYIFEKEKNKENFFSRLEFFLSKKQLLCYAWCVMGNHAHLLLQTGKTRLAEFMRSLLTSYALYYNKANKRSGYLFQNRYKSVLCDREEYFLSLVRYINLNPVKAGIVDIKKLDKYNWTSHKELLSGKKVIIEREEILTCFSSKEKLSKQLYKNFIKEGISKEENYEGGGLIRSAGGLREVMKRKNKEKDMYDARILGSGIFVEEALKLVKEEEKCVKIKNISELLLKLERFYKIEKEEILLSRTKEVREARSVFIYLANMYLKESLNKLGIMMNISESAASLSRKRGKEILSKENLLKSIMLYGVN